MIEQILSLYGNKFLTITFIKKDGSIRTINGRFNVKKHLQGGVRTVGNNYLVIYSLKDKGYRAINKDTIKSINLGGLSLYNEGLA